MRCIPVLTKSTVLFQAMRPHSDKMLTALTLYILEFLVQTMIK